LADGYDSITQTITILPATTTLVISPTTLANDQTLFAACNLEIDNGILNKKTVWDASKNTTFTNYLIDHHFTTIRFVGITSIADSAFYNCSALAASISLPSSLTSIGSSTFQNCTNLRRVEFDTSSADATVSILYGAFSGCTNLTGLWKTSPNHHLYLGSIGY
jgi:hypothetical protein